MADIASTPAWPGPLPPNDASTWPCVRAPSSVGLPTVARVIACIATTAVSPEFPQHYIYDMGIARALDTGCNSYAQTDVEYLELGHELGHRVHIAILWDMMGMGALFDLSYAFYHTEIDPCTCGLVGGHLSSHATGRNWREDCYAHGTESPWYHLYGKRRLEIRDAQARRLQARARERRQAHGR